MIRSLTRLGVRVPDGFAITADAYAISCAKRAWRGGRRASLGPAARRRARPGGAQRQAPQPHHLGGASGRPAGGNARAYRELSSRYSVEFSGRRRPFLGDGGGLAGRQLRAPAGHLFEHPRRTGGAGRGAPLLREPLHRPGHRLPRGHGIRHLDVALSVASRRWSAPTWPRRACSSPSTGERPPRRGAGHRQLGPGRGGGARQVVPDQFYVHKPTLRDGHRSLVWKTVGSKEQRMVYAAPGSGKLSSCSPCPTRCVRAPA